jgi:hypothetical protein
MGKSVLPREPLGRAGHGASGCRPCTLGNRGEVGLFIADGLRPPMSIRYRGTNRGELWDSPEAAYHSALEGLAHVAEIHAEEVEAYREHAAELLGHARLRARRRTFHARHQSPESLWARSGSRRGPGGGRSARIVAIPNARVPVPPNRGRTCLGSYRPEIDLPPSPDRTPGIPGNCRSHGVRTEPSPPCWQIAERS